MTLPSSSLHSSKVSINYVTNVLERLQNRQTRESTTKNYLSIWRHLNKFIISLDSCENLSWEEKTALFGAFLVDRGVQSTTLKSYFSAIKHILHLDGYQWNDNKALLSSLVRGCRLENDRVKVRLPIHKSLLEALLFELERYYYDNPQPYLECMFKALFCLAYYDMLRVGELTYSPHVVKACNIHVGGNKDKILVVLYSSKTHGKESLPQKVRISAAPYSKNRHAQRFFCPFKSVIRYMSIRGVYLTETEQFFVYADRSPVMAFQVRTLLRTLLDNISLDSHLYDVHSFRIGCTCDLEKFGYSISQIKTMGRWKSNTVYRYLKN